MKVWAIAWVVALSACGGDESGKDAAADGSDGTADSADESAADSAVDSTVDSADSAADSAVDSADSAADSADDGAGDADTTAWAFPCTERAAVVPTERFFTEISKASGIQAGNYLTKFRQSVPINDHSRLAFVDLDDDGWDDVIAGNLFVNPQAGIPYEHLVFLNNHDGTFRDASEESGLRDIQAGMFAFGDVDNDGDLDLFAGLDADAVPDGKHGIYMNDGAGHFTEKPNAGITLTNTAAAVGTAIFADFDGDAKLDLYLGIGQTSYLGEDVLFMGRGDGTFAYAKTRLTGNQRLQSNGSVACDFDDDGDMDIFVSTYGVSVGKGHNLLWQNDGAGNFTEVGEAKGYAAQATGNYWLPSTGRGVDPEPNATPATYIGDNGFGVDCDDIDNDGHMDVFQTSISHPVDSDYSRKWSDPTQLLHNLGADGGYAFENRFLALGLPFNEGDVDGGVIDFDNDGRLDLSLSRESKYESAYVGDDQQGWFGLMHQKADGTFESLGVHSGINNLASRYSASLTACADDSVCPDGERCMFAACRTPCSSDDDCPSGETGESCGAFWNADTNRAQTFCRPLLQGKRAQNHAWSDIDHDGDLDLLVGGRDGGGGRPNFLFRNELGQDNRWLAIQVEGDGVHVNRDGIGARIVLTAGERRQTREVQGSRGSYNSMDGMTQHFGLGDFPCGATIDVRWPDGTTHRFAAGSYPEGRYLKLAYPDQLTWDAE